MWTEWRSLPSICSIYVFFRYFQHLMEFDNDGENIMMWPPVRSLVKQWFQLTGYDASYTSGPRPFCYHSIRRPNNGFELWRTVLRNAEISMGGFGEVSIWLAQWRTIENECRTVMKMCYSICTMLKICTMTNWNQASAKSYAHQPIYLHQLRGGCRVLLLRPNSFDDWPPSIAKRCI